MKHCVQCLGIHLHTWARSRGMLGGGQVHMFSIHGSRFSKGLKPTGNVASYLLPGDNGDQFGATLLDPGQRELRSRTDPRTSLALLPGSRLSQFPFSPPLLPPGLLHGPSLSPPPSFHIWIQLENNRLSVNASTSLCPGSSSSELCFSQAWQGKRGQKS